MKVHDDDFASRRVQKVPHIFYDLRKGCDANDVVIDPEPTYVVTFLVESSAVRYRRIISNPDIQISYTVHQLRPYVAILSQQIPLKSVPARQVAVFITTGIMCPGYHQAADRKHADFSSTIISPLY